MKRRVPINSIDGLSLLKTPKGKGEFVVHVPAEYDYWYYFKDNSFDNREHVVEIIKRVWWNTYSDNLPIYVFSDIEKDNSLKRVVTNEDDFKKQYNDKHPKY